LIWSGWVVTGSNAGFGAGIGGVLMTVSRTADGRRNAIAAGTARRRQMMMIFKRALRSMSSAVYSRRGRRTLFQL
jgi:hypothetical protein